MNACLARITPPMLALALSALAACGGGSHHIPPVANAKGYSTLPDVAVNIGLTGQQFSGQATYAIATPPAHGAISGTPPAVTYTPSPGYAGRDSFTFTVSSSGGTSTPATISIAVLPTSGPAVPGTEAFELALVRQFAGAPGGFAVAVSKDGKLIYARGFGWADDAGTLFQPDTLTRTHLGPNASGVAILALVDQGRLSLDAKLLDLLPELTVPAGGDARIRDITIRHVLGWSSGLPAVADLVAAQALGVSSPVTCLQRMQYEMGRRLDFAPGASSTFGNHFEHLCALDLVLQKITGQDAQGVIRDLLATAGVHDVRRAGTRLADRAPGEAAYYALANQSGTSPFSSDQGAVLGPYGAYVASRFYLASVVDLVRFQDAVSGVGAGTPLLSTASRTLLTTPGRATGPYEGYQGYFGPAGTIYTHPSGQLAWGLGGWATGFWSGSDFVTPTGYSFAISANMSMEVDIGLPVANAVMAGFTGSATDLYPSFPSPVLPPYGGL